MSEQIGWRAILKTIKKEIPHIAKALPEMPRLAHQFLTQTNQAEMDLPLRASIDKLIEAQQQQAQWQKRLVIAIVVLAAIEIAIVTSTFVMHS
jgi:ubiquinone biosynthesis protein